MRYWVISCFCCERNVCGQNKLSVFKRARYFTVWLIGVEDVAPQLRRLGTDSVYEDYECLIDKTNTWLRDQVDITVVNLQSILVQKDLTGPWLARLIMQCIHEAIVAATGCSTVAPNACGDDRSVYAVNHSP